jgi:type IV secretory pathway TrbD component
VFVVFTGLFAAEHARGTYRTMLLRQPRRLPLLAGKLAALLLYAAGLLALLEVVMWVAGHFEASIGDVSTARWTGWDAIGAAGGDYVVVLAWVAGYAVYGMTVAMVLRSVPLALAVGIAWAGPTEHLVSDSWADAHRWFPGLLLETVGQGGTAAVSLTRALVTTACYVAVAAALTSTVFRRGGRAVMVLRGVRQAVLIAEISNSRVTFSLTSTPPVSSAAFQVMPQSLRLTATLPSNPIRSLPNGS